MSRLLPVLTLSALVIQASGPARSADPALPKRLQETLDRVVKAGRAPGLNAAVQVGDGPLIRVAAGVSDRASRKGMLPSDRMPAGSVGKTFVVGVALQLVAEGKLDLDAKAADILGKEPWFHRLPNAKSFTFRQLLNHTSGLERHEFKAAFHKDLNAFPDKSWKPEDLLAYLAGDKPLFAPGKGWGYSDSNYIVLGAALERITGRTYFDLLRTRLLQPLGLKDTLPADSRRMSGIIQGYAGADNPFGNTDAMVKDGLLAFNPQNEWTGGGVVSTPADLARWAKLLYEGKAFDPKLLPAMLDGVPSDLGPGVRYGLGVILRPTRLGPTWGHSGFFPGYMTQLLYFPERRAVVAVQVNTSVPGDVGRPLLDVALALAEAAFGKP